MQGFKSLLISLINIKYTDETLIHKMYTKDNEYYMRVPWIKK